MQLNRRKIRPLAHAGYTLIETLVAMTLSLVAMAAFTSFSRFQMFALRNQSAQTDLQTTARNVVDLFARELRHAGMNPGCDVAGLTGIAFANRSQVRTQADLDNDGTLTGANEDITYQFNSDANTIVRIDNHNSANTDTLISGVDLTGTVFRYFDSSNTELIPPSTGSLSAANCSAIRRVRLELSLKGSNVDPQVTQKLTVQVATNVDLGRRYFLGSTVCPGT